MIKNKILIIIPTFNSENCIASTLKSLQPFSQEFDVLVVDNSSDDKTLEIVEGFDVSFKSNLDFLNRIENWNRCLNYGYDSSYQYFRLLFCGDQIIQFPNLIEFSNDQISLFIDRPVFNDLNKGWQYPIHLSKYSGFIDSITSLYLMLRYKNFVYSPSAITIKNTGKRLYFDCNKKWSADFKFLFKACEKGVYLTTGKFLFNTKNRNYYLKNKSKWINKIEEFFLLVQIGTRYLKLLFLRKSCKS
jgi:glycosyltransferase involved in cell wall biosynthesis